MELTADLRRDLKRVGTAAEIKFLEPFLVSYDQIVAQPELLEGLAERLGATITSSDRDIAVDVLAYLRAIVGSLRTRKDGVVGMGEALMATEAAWAQKYPGVPYRERGMTTLLALLPD